MTSTALAPTMNDVPAVLAAAGNRARVRAREFFAANISNPNTREAYSRAVSDFCAWLEVRGLVSIADLQTLHVAAFIRELTGEFSVPTVDWLVTGGILPFNLAAAVRGPKPSTKRGKTTVLSGAEARRILDAIPDTTPGLPDLAGLRDRALIGLMVYSFARIGAAVGMRVDDVYEQQSRLWVRLHEKGGKRHDMPCHHNLEIYLRDYLARSGLAGQPKAFLFPTVLRGTGQLSTTALPREDAYAMVQRRATAAGITTKVGNHTFRATGVTTYLKNGGSLENAAAMANHASTRTTQLYDRRRDEMSLDEVERISI
jgi:integrase